MLCRSAGRRYQSTLCAGAVDGPVLALFAITAAERHLLGVIEFVVRHLAVEITILRKAAIIKKLS